MNIMKNLMIVTCLVFSISIIGFSQVKDRYRDSTNTSTIVVVKESASIDQDVLNEYFDLEAMNMNDQIMITTSIDAPDMENSTSSIDGSVEVFFAEIEEQITEKNEVIAFSENNEKAKVQSEKPALVVNSASVVPAVRKSPRRASGTYPTKSTYDIKQSASKKYFSKKKIKRNKNKRKRRKNKKRKGGSCYSF